MLGLKLMAVRVWHQNFLPKWMDVFGAKVLRIFKVLFQKHLKAEVPSRQFQHIKKKIKKHGNAVLFVRALNVGASAPNPDQRTFWKKSFGISKTFAKIKRYIRREVLLLTFLRKKSRSWKVSWNFKNFHQNKVVCLVRSSLAYLSPKER